MSFYDISHSENTAQADGVIGENIMKMAVWKIDFKNNYLHIASSADSIEGLQETDLLPAVFTDNAIEIEIQFSHSVTKKMELDLGFTGWIIMPEEECRPVIAGNKKIYTDSMPQRSGQMNNRMTSNVA